MKFYKDKKQEKRREKIGKKRVKENKKSKSEIRNQWVKWELKREEIENGKWKWEQRQAGDRERCKIIFLNDVWDCIWFTSEERLQNHRKSASLEADFL